uniref:sensor histidine kinase n=1 Tax=Nitrospira cf. moscoviensis SBR1015 TaxID=96242 RepID=UPI001180C6C9
MKAARKPSAIGSRMNRAIGMVDRLFLSLREMVAALRPSLLEELGLRAAIEALVDDLTAQSQIQCRFVADGIDAHVRWSPEVEIALFRMAQELLSNVIRHAKATTVTITLGRELGRIVLRVWDNGRGFAVRAVGKKNRFGLRGVQERAELLGGSVTINSTSRVGTTVTVEVPVEIPASVLQPKAPAKDRTAATPK